MVDSVRGDRVGSDEGKEWRIEEWSKTGCWRTKPEQGAEVLNFDRLIYIHIFEFVKLETIAR